MICDPDFTAKVKVRSVSYVVFQLITSDRSSISSDSLNGSMDEVSTCRQRRYSARRPLPNLEKSNSRLKKNHAFSLYLVTAVNQIIAPSRRPTPCLLDHATHTPSIRLSEYLIMATDHRAFDAYITLLRIVQTSAFGSDVIREASSEYFA